MSNHNAIFILQYFSSPILDHHYKTETEVYVCIHNIESRKLPFKIYFGIYLKLIQKYMEISKPASESDSLSKRSYIAVKTTRINLENAFIYTPEVYPLHYKIITALYAEPSYVPSNMIYVSLVT